MEEDKKSGFINTIIGAITAIIVALITTLGTIRVSDAEVTKVNGQLNEISEIETRINRVADSFKDLPVSTIVQSLLPPALFADQVNDPTVFDPRTTKWVIADGKLDITLSKYGQLTNKRFVPDLRGMFLRGMNEGRSDSYKDPDQNRQVGSFQSDMTKSHSHNANLKLGAEPLGQHARSKQAAGAHGSPSDSWVSDELISNSGGIETRPKNVSVYFYIKIN